MKRLLTTREVMRKFKIGYRKIEKFRRDGLPTYPIGNRVYIKEEEIEKYIDNKKEVIRWKDD